MPNFKLGDRVKVVNYGSIGWMHRKFIDQLKKNIPTYEPDNVIKTFEDGSVMFDSAPNRVGTVDIINQISYTQGKPSYSLSKSAWYNEDQLELIENK